MVAMYVWANKYKKTFSTIVVKIVSIYVVISNKT